MTKQSERRLVEIAKYYGYGWRRYGDVKRAVCMECHTTIKTCPVCRKDLFLPKTEKMPDYLIAPIETGVECKNNDSTGKWNWANDIGPEGKRVLQRQWFENSPMGGWLLIELGTKPAPKGKSAYLVPWGVWKSIEQMLLSKGMMSIRKETRKERPGADEFLSDYRLEWKKSFGWTIPKGHIWWKAYWGSLTAEISFVESML
jgi:hypothetical protein